MFPFDLRFGDKLIPCLTDGLLDEDHHQDRLKQDDIWKKAKELNLSRNRENVDGHQNFFPSGGNKPDPHYLVKQISLSEAIDQVISGEMAPMDLIRQMPDQLRSILDTFAKERFKKGLEALSVQECREVLGILRSVAEKVDEFHGAPTSHRSESRTHIDNQTNFYPSGSKNSFIGLDRGTLLVAIGVALFVVGLLAIWRWLV